MVGGLSGAAQQRLGHRDSGFMDEMPVMLDPPPPRRIRSGGKVASYWPPRWAQLGGGVGDGRQGEQI